MKHPLIFCFSLFLCKSVRITRHLAEIKSLFWKERRQILFVGKVLSWYWQHYTFWPFYWIGLRRVLQPTFLNKLEVNPGYKKWLKHSKCFWIGLSKQSSNVGSAMRHIFTNCNTDPKRQFMAVRCFFANHYRILLNLTTFTPKQRPLLNYTKTTSPFTVPRYRFVSIYVLLVTYFCPINDALESYFRNYLELLSVLCF